MRPNGASVRRIARSGFLQRHATAEIYGKRAPQTPLMAGAGRSQHRGLGDVEGLAPLVDGDHVDPKLLGYLGRTLTLDRSRPSMDISLDCLTVTTHPSIPSSPTWWLEQPGLRGTTIPGRGGWLCRYVNNGYHSHGEATELE
jgi:hypothetical protein